MQKIDLLKQYRDIITRSINVENTLYVLMRAVHEDSIDVGAYYREAEQFRNALDIIVEYQERTTTNMLELESYIESLKTPEDVEL